MDFPKIPNMKLSKFTILLIVLFLIVLLICLSCVAIFTSPFILIYFLLRWYHKRKFSTIIQDLKKEIYHLKYKK